MPPAVWKGCQHACVCDRQRERELIVPTPYSGGYSCTGVNRCYELNCSQCDGYTTLTCACVRVCVCVHAAANVCLNVFVPVFVCVSVSSAACHGHLSRPGGFRQGLQLKATQQPVKDRGEDTDWLGQDGRKL